MNRRLGAVLVVEDDALLALDLADTLERAGYAVCAPAADNEAARRTIDESSPSFAFLDYDLGSATSVPTAVELARRGIPFVYVTGRPGAVRENPLAPEAPILSKPCSTKRLLAALEGESDGFRVAAE